MCLAHPRLLPLLPPREKRAGERRAILQTFDASKISRRRFTGQMAETSGQLLCEWEHLKAKLRVRAPQMRTQLRSVRMPEPHPMFRVVPGDVRDWERT
jgi:hypothetical protein